MSLEARLRAILADGIDHGLFSAGAIAARTPHERVGPIALGTVSFDSTETVDSETSFDLASVTKTLVAATVLTLVADGVLDLVEPVERWLPVGSGPGSGAITLGHLLSHTAGLPPDCFAWRDASLTAADRLKQALSMPLVRRPGEGFGYSCLGFIAAGRIAEIATGSNLDDLVRDKVVARLGVRTLSYRPQGQVVATEVQDYAGRGLVRGQVHDELAWSLNRPVGNAGLFGTAQDLLAFASAVLDGGGNLLDPLVARMLVEQVVAPGPDSAFGHSYGLRIGDPTFMGGVRGIGHTGFTGTMFVLDPERKTAVVLLTNRVHPHRDRVDLSHYRARVTEAVAAAVDAAG